MPSILKVILICMFALILTSCGEDISERKHVDYQYLNFDAISTEDYPHDAIGDSTNDDLIKSIEGEYVKWTATIDEITSAKKVILKEDKLPDIVVRLDQKIDENFKVGDIVTVSGNLNSYVHGLFTTTPKWNMKNALLVEATEDEKAELVKYYQAIEEQKTQLVEEEEQQKVIAQETAVKEEADRVKQAEKEEADKAKKAEEEAIEQEKRNAYLATPEGMKEALTDKANSIGEVLEVHHGDKSWVIEIIGRDHLTTKLKRDRWLLDSSSFFEEVFTQYDNLADVKLLWTTELSDLKGNVSDQIVIEVQLTAENAQTINWDNFSYKNLPKIADVYWEHPAFKN